MVSSSTTRVRGPRWSRVWLRPRVPSGLGGRSASPGAEHADPGTPWDEIPHILAEAAGGRPARRQTDPASSAEPAGSAQASGLGAVLRLVGVVLATLGVAALLNADHLVDRAEKKPFGRDRDAWLAIWEPVQAASGTLYLNRPRLWLDRLIDREIAPRPLELPVPAAPSRPVAVVPAIAVDGAANHGTAPAEPLSVPPAQPIAVPPPGRRLRTATVEEPLRLFIAGDSMGVAFGASLARLASATGLIDPQTDARPSTGLTRPDFFDWPARLHEIAENDRPDVFVIMYGANDSQGLRTPDGTIFQPLTEGWRADYRRRVAGTMDLLAAPGRLQLWVGQPVMESGGFSERMAEVNLIFREEAEKRPGAVIYFDTWQIFVDGDGRYSAYLPDADGAVQGVRQGDGIHFSRAGADRLAAAVLKRLDDESPVLGR